MTRSGGEVNVKLRPQFSIVTGKLAVGAAVVGAVVGTVVGVPLHAERKHNNSSSVLMRMYVFI
jgi:hypothetical protein